MNEFLELLARAERQGADTDEPEGARYVQLSDTLLQRVQKRARTLISDRDQEWINAVTEAVRVFGVNAPTAPDAQSFAEMIEQIVAEDSPVGGLDPGDAGERFESLVAHRRWQAHAIEKRRGPKPGEFNIPQMLRDDADEIDRLQRQVRERDAEVEALRKLGQEGV